MQTRVGFGDANHLRSCSSVSAQRKSRRLTLPALTKTSSLNLPHSAAIGQERGWP